MKQDIHEKTTSTTVHDENAISTPKDGVSVSSAPLEDPVAPTQETPKPVIRRIVDSIIWFLRDQWFLVGLGILIIIASQHQIPENRQKQKATIVTYLCVSIIFFVTGCTLSTQTLIKNYARWKLHLFVQVQCFLMTSAIVFAVVSAAASNRNFMDPGLLIGMVFTGCVATTISSNVVMTRQAHGNQALTVVQSTLGNLLGPFLTPALLHMYFSGNAWYTKVLPAENSNFQEIYKRVFKQLGLSVFLPLVCSHRPCFGIRHHAVLFS
jgi:sodium/bile acid cotransporter 7